MAAEKRLSVGLTIEQKAVIESTAQAAGMTISEYVKSVFARTIPGFALVESSRLKKHSKKVKKSKSSHVPPINICPVARLSIQWLLMNLTATRPPSETSFKKKWKMNTATK